MKRPVMYCAALATWMLATPGALAQNGILQPQLVAPATHNDSYTRPLSEASPSDQAAAYVPAATSDFTLTSVDCACEPACGCEEASCCCEPSCGCGSNCSLLGDCCLGDPWTLQDCLTPCCDSPTYGGWISIGYHTNNERLSFDPDDTLAFNDFPDHLNLHQAWVYVEKVAEADCCSADFGYRFDAVYGTDAQKTQAFGNPGGRWDASWDHGVYGWAIPQLYGEVAFGDLSVKAGHFFTPAGYEVVNATGNFFYSHSVTHFNSEPFTHTGVLATYNGSDDLTLYGGWALGWDTGFDQFGSGSIFLGGFTATLVDDVSFTYITTAGNLGWRSGNQNAYTQHIVMNVTLSDNMYWVLSSDYVDSDGTLADPAFENEDFSIVNYLVYSINDCWGVGGRMEWWKSDNVLGAAGQSTSFHEVTGGINYKPHANVVLRPEIRYDWTPAEDTVDPGYNQFLFGFDAVFTF